MSVQSFNYQLFFKSRPSKITCKDPLFMVQAQFLHDTGELQHCEHKLTIL